MAQFLENLVTASFHGSIVILAVILLRLILRKTPKNPPFLKISLMNTVQILFN